MQHTKYRSCFNPTLQKYSLYIKSPAYLNKSHFSRTKQNMEQATNNSQPNSRCPTAIPLALFENPTTTSWARTTSSLSRHRWLRSAMLALTHNYLRRSTVSVTISANSKTHTRTLVTSPVTTSVISDTSPWCVVTHLCCGKSRAQQ